MTISQPSSSQISRPFGVAAFGRLVYRVLVRWRERKRAKADLARLAEAGDHLLLDVGLDPELARRNPVALLDQVIRRR
ncbi:MAG TPA: hypothetical protein VFE34_10880 [Dongiaceae bacterium]|jgi:uncharacterized protein YjiS (DUF1127 family)|nr:hypothetical protein [Dongiaceae bacterium]